ncbi:putative PcfJ protein [Bacillus phage SWEP1]|nr:putative PcfJ protein [Bacillus phage SWEP1]
MSKEKNEVLDQIKNGELELTQTIGHVNYYMIEKTGYSFHFYATYENEHGGLVLTEMLYDLRYKKYYIKRNGRLVKFNIHNADLVIPRPKDSWYRDEFYNYESKDKFFDMVSVEENKGMYVKMVKVIGSLGEEKVDMSSRALIRLMTTYNKLEMIYKAGIDISYMSNTVFRHKIERASAEEGKTKLHQIFGVTKSQYKFISEHCRDSDDFIDSINRVSHATQTEMDTYRGIQVLIKEKEVEYNLENRLRIFNNNASLSTFLNVIACNKNNQNHYRGHTFWGFVFKPRNNIKNLHRLTEYLLFGCLVSQGMEFSEAVGQYKDYYETSLLLGHEDFDKYPRSLKLCHDITSRNFKLVEDDVTKKMFEEQKEYFQKFETKMRGYSVLVPKEMKDIATEGNAQHHCVASYAPKVAKGDTIIVFLRSNEELDKPLVTVEIRGNKIVQARGFGNRVATADEKQALTRFAKKHELEYKSA